MGQPQNKRIEGTKLSLSRKGFDSSAGGISSPIIEDRFISLPIPESGSDCFYKDLRIDKYTGTVLDLIRQLGARQYSECHLDPILSPEIYGLDREKGWYPAFGQDEAAASHLMSTHQFREGDIFLFFGNFRKAHISADHKISFKKGNDSFHAIYGFMEVGEIICPEDKSIVIDKKYANHPHVRMRGKNYYKSNSTVFLPARKSKHGFSQTCGVFKYTEVLRLTSSLEKSKMRSWKLPVELSHLNFSYFQKNQTSNQLLAPGRGQELVADIDQKVIDWIRNLIQNNLLIA